MEKKCTNLPKFEYIFPVNFTSLIIWLEISWIRWKNEIRLISQYSSVIVTFNSIGFSSDRFIIIIDLNLYYIIINVYYMLMLYNAYRIRHAFTYLYLINLLIAYIWLALLPPSSNFWIRHWLRDIEYSFHARQYDRVRSRDQRWNTQRVNRTLHTSRYYTCVYVTCEIIFMFSVFFCVG